MALFARKKEVKEKAVSPDEMYGSDVVEPEEPQYQKGPRMLDKVAAGVERLGDGLSQSVGGYEQEEYEQLNTVEEPVQRKPVMRPQLPPTPQQRPQPRPQPQQPSISDVQLMEAFAEVDKRLIDLSERLTNIELKLFRKGL